MDASIQPRPEAHPACASCGKPVCLWAPDWSLACFSDCTADNGERIEGDAVHDDCREHYFTLKVRDEIARSLEERRGFELNGPIIQERSANTAIRVMELLRSLGVVEHNRKRG